MAGAKDGCATPKIDESYLSLSDHGVEEGTAEREGAKEGCTEGAARGYCLRRRGGLRARYCRQRRGHKRLS